MDQNIRNDLLKLFRENLSQAMKFYLETCSRCGLCVQACHVHASMPQLRYIAAYRAEIIRKIYRKYFKAQGRFFPWLSEAKELNDDALQELNEAAFSCTGCRRCMVYCPHGIDTEMLMSMAKLLLVGARREPEMLSLLADTSIEKGKSLALFKKDFLTGIKSLESRVVEKWKCPAGQAPIPVDVQGADILYVPLSGARSIIPAAAIFNAAGRNWTLSFFEAVNFGAFLGDPARTRLILERIIDEARRLKVKKVVACECGTAFRVMKQLSGKQPFEVVSIVQEMARYLKEGLIRVNRFRCSGPITYHDPCQIARNGGVINEPREILRHLAQDFREMSPDPAYNWCCGGGGGLVAMGEDTLDFRMKSARVKVEQILATGAEIVVTACENCHTQLSDLNDHYKMGVEIRLLSSMVADALVGPEETASTNPEKRKLRETTGIPA